jgi:hypothetical protein
VPPGSRVVTTPNPAARTVSAVNAMLVDFPTPSMPSNEMNAPRTT